MGKSNEKNNDKTSAYELLVKSKEKAVYGNRENKKKNRDELEGMIHILSEEIDRLNNMLNAYSIKNDKKPEARV